jgi:phosphatidylserine decarboxylase
VIEATPRSAFTGLVGYLSDRPVPVLLRPLVLGALARHFGIDLAEAGSDLSAYPTFQALFCRALRPGCRPEPGPGDDLVSPIDGRLSETGPIGPDCVLMIKGRPYSVAALLLDGERAQRFAGGRYWLFYLSPRDYHRMHSPVDAQVTEYRWVRGDLWPVDESLVEHLPGVYHDNERVVSYLETAPGDVVAMIKIAALGVGHVTLQYLDEAPGDRRRALDRPLHRCFALDDAPTLGRGDALAAFGLGSTVVLLTEPGTYVPLPGREGAPIRVGEPFARRQTPGETP